MYKINVIAHMLKGDKIAKAGELVSEEQLAGNVKTLLNEGYIVQASKKEVEEWKKSKSSVEAAKKKEEEAKKAEAEAAKKKEEEAKKAEAEAAKKKEEEAKKAEAEAAKK
ncbi:hypothetical protein [Muricauda sp. MAR_2010_75]|uniref:hypothetical protein n=1 Tax=Allomuricauda sp. MAR_2010_75 TaxID=1250232 RepID=UPI000ABF14AF|nr:hypothetical protein [Muricauda sp. MAR_2010_75]